jgi:hypothetical protein
MVANKLHRAQGVRRGGLGQQGTKIFGEEGGLVYQWLFVQSWKSSIRVFDRSSVGQDALLGTIEGQRGASEANRSDLSTRL